MVYDRKLRRNLIYVTNQT